MYRRSNAFIAAGALTIGLLLAPTAGSASDPTDSPATLEFLYALSTEDIRVRPGAGVSARIVLQRPIVTRFTDRPTRDAVDVHPAVMLTAFGWTPEVKRLRGKTPNAAITIPGGDTQVVRIRTAAIRGDRVILRVSGIAGAVTRRAGAGSLFVDSTTLTQVQSQTVTLSSSPNLTMTGVVYSDSTLTITLSSDGTDIASETINPTMGASTWTPSFTLPGGGQVNDLRVGATFIADYTGGDSQAYVQALGQIVLPPPDLLAVASGSLQFTNIPRPAPAPWPPPLPPGFDNPTG